MTSHGHQGVKGGPRERGQVRCNSGEGHMGGMAPEPLRSMAKTRRYLESCFNTGPSPPRQDTQDQGALPGLESPGAPVHPNPQLPQPDTHVGLKVVRTRRWQKARTDGPRLDSVREEGQVSHVRGEKAARDSSELASRA